MNRLYGVEHRIIGLTGGIATGKSSVCDILRELGLHIICADSLVHEIYSLSESIDFIKGLSEDFVTAECKIDFVKLRSAFFNDSDLKDKIEKYIYSKLEETFKEKAKNIPIESPIIYDVPLLFELELHKKVDSTICVFCPRDIQITRIIARDNNSRELAEMILNNQMDIQKKKELANYVIDNTSNFQTLRLNTARVIHLAISDL